MIEEQKNRMNVKLKQKREELEEVLRQKEEDIRTKDELLKKIAAQDQHRKEMEIKLFAADADIIMEEFTEMEQAKELKALKMQLTREAGQGDRPTHARVPKNG